MDERHAPGANEAEASTAADAQPSRASGVGAGGRPNERPPVLVCQVQGCGASLLPNTEFHQRYRICPVHLKMDQVTGKDGELVRFCQQCGRFQPLHLFDGNRRSCRERLARHNARRRRRMGLDPPAPAAASQSGQSDEAGGQAEGAIPGHATPRGGTGGAGTASVGALAAAAAWHTRTMDPGHHSMRPSSAPSLTSSFATSHSMPTDSGLSYELINLHRQPSAGGPMPAPAPAPSLPPGNLAPFQSRRPSWLEPLSCDPGCGMSLDGSEGPAGPWQVPRAALLAANPARAASSLGPGAGGGPSALSPFSAAREFLQHRPHVRPRHEPRPVTWPAASLEDQIFTQHFGAGPYDSVGSAPVLFSDTGMAQQSAAGSAHGIDAQRFASAPATFQTSDYNEALAMLGDQHMWQQHAQHPQHPQQQQQQQQQEQQHGFLQQQLPRMMGMAPCHLPAENAMQPPFMAGMVGSTTSHLGAATFQSLPQDPPLQPERRTLGEEQTLESIWETLQH